MDCRDTNFVTRIQSVAVARRYSDFVEQASAEIASKVGHFRALPLRSLGAVIRFSYHIGCCVTLKTDAVGKLLISQERMRCTLFDNGSVRYLFSFAHITW